MAAYKIRVDSTPCPGVDIEYWAFDNGSDFVVRGQRYAYISDARAAANRICAGLGAGGRGGGTTANVTVSINKIGQGMVHSSGAGNSLAERSSITVPQGYQIYFQAMNVSGWTFQKWKSADGTESVVNPLTVTVDKSGSITAVFVQDTTTGGGTSACSRGDSFRAGATELVLGCPTGYSRPVGSDYCYCDSTSGDKSTTGSKGMTLDDLMKYAPYLILAFVVATVIGAFRK